MIDKNKTLIEKFIRALRRTMYKGHDDFYNCLCIDVEDFDNLKKKYVELSKKTQKNTATHT